jgi:hypothetical protein
MRMHPQKTGQNGPKALPRTEKLAAIGSKKLAGDKRESLQ